MVLMTEFWKSNLCSTLRLVFVILLLEITDLMFALDSVSAKIAAVPGHCPTLQTVFN
jgi:predicted tellurium resistance membrane protein TerC